MRKTNLIIPAMISLINIALIIFIVYSKPAHGSEASNDVSEGGRQVTPVYVVIQFSPEEYRVEEVQLEDPASGFEVLKQTGLEISANDFGDGFFAVCAIEGVGCPSNDCFCDEDTFWNYQYWDGTEWFDYQVGATETRIEAGAVEGWRWGEFASYSLPPADEILPNE